MSLKTKKSATFQSVAFRPVSITLTSNPEGTWNIGLPGRLDVVKSATIKAKADGTWEAKCSYPKK